MTPTTSPPRRHAVGVASFPTRDDVGPSLLGEAVVGRLGTDPERITNLFPRQSVPIPANAPTGHG